MVSKELEIAFCELQIATEDIVVETVQMLKDDYNAAMIGKTLDVLVDGFDEELEQFYGRTYADSPDIDGRVWLASEMPLREGQFVMAHIDGCIEGDLSGYVLED